MVSESIVGEQEFPQIADGPDGFAVVWDQVVIGPPDPSGTTSIMSVMMRDLSLSGTPIGTESPAIGPDRVLKLGSRVGTAPNGNRLVVWDQASPEGQLTDRGEVFGSLYDAAGNSIFEKRRINNHLPGDQIAHAIAADGNSDFIVIWESQPFDSGAGKVPSQDGSGNAVYARRISPSGEFLGPEFRVNTHTKGDQWPGSVAAAPDGRFVIVWVSVGQDGSKGGIYGQLFAPDGRRIGPEFRVNEHRTGWQWFPDVAIDHWGNFVVVWQSQGQDGSGEGVYARRYFADGRPRGQEFLVTQNTASDQDRPRIAMDSNGDFVVIWVDWSARPLPPEIVARSFRSNGKPAGPEFRVNHRNCRTCGFEEDSPDVALSDNGTMVAVWQGFAQEGEAPPEETWGIFGRRFVTPFPSRCVPSETTLCLGGGRFRVEANWAYRVGEDTIVHGPGEPLRLREDTGAFSFFEPSNLELLVKVLDGCDVNGHFWLFAGGLTDTDVELTVVDTATGEIRAYRSPAGTPFQPIQDTLAFATCEAEFVAVPSPPASGAKAASPACVGEGPTLCLDDGRYEAKTTWRTRDGSTGAGRAVPITAGTGAFWFFDEDNLELLVKMIDGCGVNSRHWVFAGGLTDVEVTLTVRDRVTGTQQTYSNAAGTVFPPLQDTQSLPCP